MVAAELVKSYNIDPKIVIDDPENRRLLMALVDFAQKLQRYGIFVKVCNAASLNKLAELSSERKTQIRTHFENWGKWIEPDAGAPEIIEVDDEKERTFLKRALDHYGVWIHDEMWATIRKGLVIEVYGSDMVQLYRNIHFFQFSSYSLLEISVFEWYTLWKRPSMIQEAMLEDAVACMETITPIRPYKVPRHVLRETKDPDTTLMHEPRACHVQFKDVASVCRGLDRRPAGAIATSDAELIAIGDGDAPRGQIDHPGRARRPRRLSCHARPGVGRGDGGAFATGGKHIGRHVHRELLRHVADRQFRVAELEGRLAGVRRIRAAGAIGCRRHRVVRLGRTPQIGRAHV